MDESELCPISLPPSRCSFLFFREVFRSGHKNCPSRFFSDGRICFRNHFWLALHFHDLGVSRLFGSAGIVVLQYV